MFPRRYINLLLAAQELFRFTKGVARVNVTFKVTFSWWDAQTLGAVPATMAAANLTGRSPAHHKQHSIHSTAKGSRRQGDKEDTAWAAS